MRSAITFKSSSASSLLFCASSSAFTSSPLLATSSRRMTFAAASKSKSASGAWVGELERMLKNRDEERKKLEALAESENLNLTQDERDKMKLVAQLMMKDDEVLEVKRIHSLSMERIQDHQRRNMQTSEEKGMYVEDAINKQVLDAFSNTDYNKKRVTLHWMQSRKMRYFFIAGKFVGTATAWWTIHWWYSCDPNLMWVENPSRLYYPHVRTSDVGVSVN